MKQSECLAFLSRSLAALALGDVFINSLVYFFVVTKVPFTLIPKNGAMSDFYPFFNS